MLNPIKLARDMESEGLPRAKAETIAEIASQRHEPGFDPQYWHWRLMQAGFDDRQAEGVLKLLFHVEL